MKKIIAVFAIVIIMAPLSVRAAVPDGVYLFGDGRGYDINAIWRYLCFMNEKCYDVITGMFAFDRKTEVVEVSNPVPVSSVKSSNLYFKGDVVSWNTGVGRMTTRDDFDFSLDSINPKYYQDLSYQWGDRFVIQITAEKGSVCYKSGNELWQGQVQFNDAGSFTATALDYKNYEVLKNHSGQQMEFKVSCDDGNENSVVLNLK